MGKFLTHKALDASLWQAVYECPLPKYPELELLDRAFQLLTDDLATNCLAEDWSVDVQCAHVDRACEKVKEIIRLRPAAFKRWAKKHPIGTANETDIPF